METAAPDLLRSCLDHVNEAFFVVELSSGEIIDVNQPACEMHGYSREELIGLTPPDISETFPDTVSWTQHIEEVKNHGRMSLYTYHIHRDGHRIPVDVDVDYVELDDREYLLASACEIEDRELNENPRYKHHGRYSSVFHHAPIGLWEEDFSAVKQTIDELRADGVEKFEEYFREHPDVLDECLEAIQIVNVNPRAIDLYDASDEEALREHFRKTVISDYREDMKDQLVKLIHGQETIEQTGQTKTVDGEEIEVRLKMVIPPGHRDDWGQVFVSVEDISEVVQAKQALKRSEKRYRSIFENTAVGITTTDPEGHILEANPSFADMLGYDVDQVESEHIEQFVHEKDREQCELQIPKLLNQQHDQLDFETRYETGAGDVIWVYQSNTVVRDDQGNPDYLLMITREITERKRTRDKLESLVENAPVAIAGVDEDGKVIDWNPAAEEMFGWPKEDVVGEPLPTVPEDCQDEPEEFLANISAGEPIKSVETVRQHRDGSEIPVLLSTARYPIKGKETEGALGMYVDISDQRDIRDELERREQRLRSLVSSVPGIVYRCLMDKHWTMKFISENVENVTGYQADSFVDNRDRSYADVIHPEDRDHVLETAETAVNNDEPFEIEYRIIHRSGEVRWVFERGQAIYGDDGDVQFLHGVILDVTERVEAQKALERSERGLRKFHQITTDTDLDFQEQVQQVLQLACDRLNMDTGLVTSLADDDQLMIERAEGVYADQLMHESLSLSVTHCRETIKSEGLHVVHDAIREGFEEIAEVDPSFDSYIGSRVIVDGRIQGTVCFEGLHSKEDSFTQHDQNFVRMIAHWLGFEKQRRRTQEKLERSEQRFRSTFEQAAVGIAHVDQDGTFRRVNDKFCSLLGYSEDELIELDFQELTHPDDLERDLEHAERLLEGEKDQYSIEKRYFRKDDSILWVRLTVGVVRREEASVYFVSVIEDITDRKRAEKELAESERQFRQLAENIEGVFWLVEPESEEVLYASPAYEDIWQRPREELYEDWTKMKEPIHPDDRAQMDQVLPVDKDTNFEIEYRIRQPDGEIRWIQDRAFPVENEAGEVVRVAGVAEDITERKRAEKELRESERRFRELAENIEQVFWLTDPDKERTLYISPAYEKIWGRSPDEVFDNPSEFLEGIHPDDRETVEQAIPQQKKGEYDLEYRVIQPDGEVRWVHDRAFPVENDDGEIVRIAGIAEDITERKELRRERDQFFSLSLDMVCVADLDGFYRDLNPTFTETLGYSRETLMSKPFLEFIHPDDRDDTRNVMERLEHGEDVYEFENRYLTKDDEVRWFSWNATSFGDRIYAVARDITDERRYRKRLEKTLDEKEILLEEVHHRVKNNLQVIISLLDMQSRQIDDPETLEAFNESVSRIRSMALIHEKLYETDSLESVDLSHYLEELCEYLMQSRSGPDQQYTTNLEAITLPLEKAIPLGMIVNELVSNALEHGMGSDGGHVTVSFKRWDEGTELVVSDAGPGLAEDVDPMTASTMGMKIIRALTEHELGGNLEFIEDDGLTVRVRIPRVD